MERQIEKKEQQLRKIAHEMAQKDDLKTVALGTSKINYMDPRISVAWCKKHDVPIEKVSDLTAHFSAVGLSQEVKKKILRMCLSFS